MRPARWFEVVTQDVRYALRTLRASPGFTLIAVAMLALGIGANTAIFSVVSAVLLKPLPFPEPNRLVLLWEDFSAVGGPPRTEAAPADYVAWQERSRSFADMAGFATETFNLTGTGDPDKLSGVRTSANLFAVLGMQPLLGRTLTASDDAPDAAPVVVLDARVWRSHFGADAGIVGRTIHLNGLARTVVGIVPPDFRFPDKEVMLWVPAHFTAAELSQTGNYFMYVVARLKAGVSLAQAQAEMTAIARRLDRDASRSTRRSPGVTVAGLHEHLTRDARPAVIVLLAAVALVLLIAGANLANLLLARGARRVRELSVRQALGATRRRVIAQILAENAVLAMVGAALGVALAVPTLSYLARLVPSGLPDATAPGLDLRVLLFTLGVTAAVVIGFGTGPAFAATGAHLETALRSGVGRATRRTRRVRSALVIAELTLTVVLLIGAGLLVRSYARVLAVDPGFNPHHVLVAETVLSPSRYGRAVPREAFYDGVLARVRALPGVTGAGFVNFPPFVFKGGRMYIGAPGEPVPRPEEVSKFVAIDRTVSPGYFGALGIPLLHGRDFEDRDAGSPTRVAIVNQKMADLHWPGRDPIGRQIKLGPPNAPGALLTVVGVIADVHQIGLDAPVETEMYFAGNQSPDDAPFLWPQYLVVRTADDPLAMAASVRSAVWSVDPDQSVANMRSMDAVFDAELLNRSTQLTLVSAFAVLAFVLAAIGLYGVLAYSVAQRLPEIGVKMALGARRATVVFEIVRGAMILAATGILLGLAAAFAATRVLRAWLFEISPADAATFAGTAAVLVTMALVASAIPALRGASVDPTSVLRSE